MGRLTGKTAIITGASQGMGSAHARMFAHEGAKVILTDVNAAAGQALAAEIGASAAFMAHDVRDFQQWQFVVAEGERQFGRINTLISNAGVLGRVAEMDDFSGQEFLDVCAVNQLGVYLGMKAVIPSIIAAGGGSVVNVSSIAGMVGLQASSNFAYVASKFAVRGMSKYAAVRYGPEKVRVNSVHPGYIKTPMMVAATDAEGGGAASSIPLRRFAEADEVANLMVFLASDESSFISGTEQVIDGAMLAG